MKDTDPEFWRVLESGKTVVPVKNVQDLPEDIVDAGDNNDYTDDSDISMPAMVGFMTVGDASKNRLVLAGGGLQRKAVAEDTTEMADSAPDTVVANPNLRRSGRQTQSNRRYAGWWRHDVDEESDIED